MKFNVKLIITLTLVGGIFFLFHCGNDDVEPIPPTGTGIMTGTNTGIATGTSTGTPVGTNTGTVTGTLTGTATGTSTGTNTGTATGTSTDYFLVVVENSLQSALSSSLSTYSSDLLLDGVTVRISNWTGGNASDLRNLLNTEKTNYNIEGALLIGNLPTVWYEQIAFSSHEEFPCDFYFMDLDSTWGDADSDTKFDSHSTLYLDIFVSRLMGSATDIQAYFTKNHNYRTNGSLVPAEAYIFKDDDWEYFSAGLDWELNNLYSTIHKCEATTITTRANYVNKLTTSNGAEFVYQWIHSYPSQLVIEGVGSGNISTSNIISYDFKGSFYNLFDCSASRFTENNLAMTYVLRTSYGLATIGSTKVGGIYSPNIFHQQLGSGKTWGEAYLQWYNGNGRYNDEWYLGIVILGDSMLTISPNLSRSMQTMSMPQPTKEQIEQLRQIEIKFLQEAKPKLGTFEEYKQANPQFFKK